MRILVLAIAVLCAACGKKTAPKTPAPQTEPDKADQKPPDVEAVPRTTAPPPKPGDPCDGGEKPKP